MAAPRKQSAKTSQAKQAAPRKQSAKTGGYELVHDALLYIDGDETHDLGDELPEVRRGRVFTEAELPKAALERGLETGALVPAGTSDTPEAESSDASDPADESDT